MRYSKHFQEYVVVSSRDKLGDVPLVTANAAVCYLLRFV